MKEPPKRQYRKTTVEALPDEPPAKLLTVAEAADRLGLTHWTIRDYIRHGRLTGYRVGPKMLRVDAAEIEALIVRR